LLFSVVQSENDNFLDAPNGGRDDGDRCCNSGTHMAKPRKKAVSGVSKNTAASGGKTAGASTRQKAAASDSARREDILRAAQLAEEAVSAAVQGHTKVDVQQVHQDERAVYLAVHGARDQK
jgi:type IV secretory pathway TrbL component